jgi:hypothetical protein
MGEVAVEEVMEVEEVDRGGGGGGGGVSMARVGGRCLCLVCLPRRGCLFVSHQCASDFGSGACF